MSNPKDKIGEDLLGRMYGGVILAVEPYIKDFVIIPATTANFRYRPELEEVIQVIVRAHPDNSGRVWVNIREAASSENGWPLDPNDWVKLTVLNMRNLQILIVADNDKVIIGKSS